MTSDSWPGASPRLGRGAFAAGLIALGAIAPSAPVALAAGERIDFNGELNYDAFKRASAKGSTIRITQSPGGTGAAAMVLGRAKGLVIDGRCQSACAWAFVQNANACFTQRASFDFHAAHDPGTGRRLTAATDYWLSTVGPELRARLAGLRSSSNLIRVSAKEMARYYGGRVCGASGQRTVVADSTSRAETAARVTKVASAETPQKHEETAKAAPAVTSRREFWSNADDEAAVEALVTAQESTGIIIASLVQDSTATSAATSPAEDRGTGLIGELMPSLPGEAATPEIASWPIPAYIVWGGVTASTIDHQTELAAHRDAPTSDG